MLWFRRCNFDHPYSVWSQCILWCLQKRAQYRNPYYSVLLELQNGFITKNSMNLLSDFMYCYCNHRGIKDVVVAAAAMVGNGKQSLTQCSLLMTWWKIKRRRHSSLCFLPLAYGSVTISCLAHLWKETDASPMPLPCFPFQKISRYMKEEAIAELNGELCMPCILCETKGSPKQLAKWGGGGQERRGRGGSNNDVELLHSRFSKITLVECVHIISSCSTQAIATVMEWYSKILDTFIILYVHRTISKGRLS